MFKYIIPTVDLAVLDVFLSSPVIPSIKDRLYICIDNTELYEKAINDKKYNSYNIINMAKIVSDKLKEYNCDLEKFQHFKTFHKIWLYDWCLDNGITEIQAHDDDIYLFKEIPYTENTFVLDLLNRKPLVNYYINGFWNKYAEVLNEKIFCVGDMTLKFDSYMIFRWKKLLKEWVEIINSNTMPEKRCKTFRFFMDTAFLNITLNVPEIKKDYTNKYYIVSTQNSHYFSDKFNIERIKSSKIAIHFSGKDKEKIYQRWNDILK